MLVNVCAPAANSGIGCRLYWRGHSIHTIQARLATNAPWGWRDGTVTAVRGNHIGVLYVASGNEAICWHHQDLTEGLAVGEPVRVHEEFGVLATPVGWRSVVISDGLGAVPPPPDAWTWEAEIHPAIVDVAAGSAWEIR